MGKDVKGLYTPPYELDGWKQRIIENFEKGSNHHTQITCWLKDAVFDSMCNTIIWSHRFALKKVFNEWATTWPDLKRFSHKVR